MSIYLWCLCVFCAAQLGQHICYYIVIYFICMCEVYLHAAAAVYKQFKSPIPFCIYILIVNSDLNMCVYNMHFKYIFLYITNKGGNFYNSVCMCYGRANLFSIMCSCIYKCGKSSHLKTIIYYHIESIYILPTNCILLYTLIYMFKHIRLIRKINTFNNLVCVYKKKE